MVYRHFVPFVYVYLGYFPRLRELEAEEFNFSARGAARERTDWTRSGGGEIYPSLQESELNLKECEPW